jgi:hypothetical protein
LNFAAVSLVLIDPPIAHVPVELFLSVPDA